MKLTISGNKKNEIYDFETEMFAKYKKAVAPYLHLFHELGCELKLELGWANPIRKIWSDKPIALINGYECSVCCSVEKEGKELRIESKDGEADYYVLGTSWMVSSVCRKFLSLKLSLYESVDEVDADLMEFLSQLK